MPNTLERDQNWIPQEIVDFNTDKNLNDIITTWTVENIHQTIQNKDDFTWWPWAIPWFIGAIQTTTNQKLVKEIQQN